MQVGKSDGAEVGHVARLWRQPVRVADYEEHAKTLLSQPIWTYFGGRDSGTEGHASDHCRDNDDVPSLLFQPRVLVNVDAKLRDLGTTVLTSRFASPVVVATSALQRLAHDDGEVATVKAATGRGCLVCVHHASSVDVVDVREAIGRDAVLWMEVELFKDRCITRSLITRARQAGVRALVMPVNRPYLHPDDPVSTLTLPRTIQPAHYQPHLKPGESWPTFYASQLDPSLTWDDVRWVMETSQLDVIVKGILHPDDAREAAALGCKGVILSTHPSNRRTAVSPLRVLENVAQALSEDSTEVYVCADQAIRSGLDILKALALGAKAVFVETPINFALAAQGQRGVENLLDMLNNELETGIALLGCTRPSQLGQGHVVWESDLAKALQTRL